MISIKLDIDVEDIKKLSEQFSYGLTEAAFPHLSHALTSSAQDIHRAWTGYLNGEVNLGIPQIEKVTKDMITSVKITNPKEFERNISSDNKNMEKAIAGSPDVTYDMKKTHPYGRKSRVSKKGIPYLIIPFRWGTPNGHDTKRRWNSFIPMKQYRVNVLPMEMSERTDRLHNEKNAKGEDVARSEYIWRERLEGWDDRSAGMVRMIDQGKSTYFTFRIISAASKQGSWIYYRKGQQAVDIISALEKNLGPDIQKKLENAVKADEDELNS